MSSIKEAAQNLWLKLLSCFKGYTCRNFLAFVPYRYPWRVWLIQHWVVDCNCIFKVTVFTRNQCRTSIHTPYEADTNGIHSFCSLYTSFYCWYQRCEVARISRFTGWQCWINIVSVGGETCRGWRTSLWWCPWTVNVQVLFRFPNWPDLIVYWMGKNRPLITEFVRFSQASASVTEQTILVL